MTDRSTKLDSYFDTVSRRIQDKIAKSSAGELEKRDMCEGINELKKIHLKYKMEFMSFFQPFINHNAVLSNIINAQETSCLEQHKK